MMDKLWGALSTVIRMNDKVVSLAAVTVAQQVKIEDLTARVIRLETALEIALSVRGTDPPKRLSRRKNNERYM